MKKINFNGVIICLLFILVLVFLYDFYSVKKSQQFLLLPPAFSKIEYEEQITILRKKYNNEDVMGILSIQNTDFKTPVMQGKDNSYYLNHLPNNSFNINGSVFFDYRVNVDNESKLLVFGHSSPSYDLPIEIIQNYADKSYWENHKYIYLDTVNEQRKYLVFSAYVETNDFDYMKLSYNGATDKEKHYNKLKENSFYDTNVSVDINDKILIIQTCSTLDAYNHFNKKYFLLIAKLVSE